MSAGIIGLVIGGGKLPEKVIEALRIKGIGFKAVVLDGFAECVPLLNAEDYIKIKLGQVGSGIAFFRKFGITEILMIGSVKRPSLTSLLPDLWTAKFLLKISLKSLGDDGMLKAITAALKDEGFSIIGVQDVVDDIFAKEGTYGKTVPDDRAMADIRYGVSLLKSLSSLDIGQGIVIQQGLVIAVEAIEGTDNMLTRVKDFKREGAAPVLVKMKKIGQHDKLDLPTVGSSTVITAHKNGVRGIAVQAGGVLIADYENMVKTADELGVFIYGYNLSQY